MELMGEKTLARRTMIDAGVAVVPGTADPIATPEEALQIATDIGVPVFSRQLLAVVVKARLVHSLDDVVGAFEAARREAISSFGDEAVYVEKAIIGPRHIEVQVLADSHGNVVYVGDRECSVQRRHQKLSRAPRRISVMRLV